MPYKIPSSTFSNPFKPNFDIRSKAQSGPEQLVEVLSGKRMGWRCGQLFEYGQWYWSDTNVASCRVEEARRVCKEIFHIDSSDNIDSHDIAQTNSGLNLFTINAFGQAHSVSHMGFLVTILIILAIVLSIWLVRKHFHSIKDAVRGPKTRRTRPGQVVMLDHPAEQTNITLSAAQLRQLAEALSPAIRDRHFEEVHEREMGCSRPMRASRPTATRLTPREDRDKEPIVGIHSQPISQLGGLAGE